MTAPPPARTIDEVVAYLDDVIEDCRRQESRMGYFAALYRRVTVEVKGRMDKGSFKDAERMESLDVLFANRYLDAYHRHRRGETPTRAWAYSFAAADDPEPVVLQHLLMGMNAHIHLDLGIAAAEVVRRHRLRGFKHDFDLINAVLFDLVDEIQTEVNHTSGMMTTLDWITGRLDEYVLGFALAQARRRAWRRAASLMGVPTTFHGSLVDRFDRHTEGLAQRIHLLPSPVNILLNPLREVEQEPVRAIIDRLT
ncbi:MAG TPA: DUF5995 family protein [Rhodothermales bacterium]|nr:DUF5995 family protein [Rhodothermales bacterium]